MNLIEKTFVIYDELSKTYKTANGFGAPLKRAKKYASFGVARGLAISYLTNYKHLKLQLRVVEFHLSLNKTTPITLDEVNAVLNKKADKIKKREISAAKDGVVRAQEALDRALTRERKTK